MIFQSIITIIILISIIAAVGFISEKAARNGLLHVELSRKFLHFTAVLLAAYSVILVEAEYLLKPIVFFGVIISFLIIKYDFLPAIHEKKRKSWGVLYFPLAFFLLLILFNDSFNWIIFSSLLILAVSDSLAAITGTFLSKKQFRLTSDKKSIIGSSFFFISSTIIFFAIFSDWIPIVSEKITFQLLPIEILIIASVIFSIILTAFEAISSKGFDNFTIPIVAAFLFYVFYLQASPEFIINFSIGILLSAAVAILSYRVKFLTADGAVATFLLAGFIFGLGGWMWSLPILAFFILSSLLSKLRKKVNAEIEEFFEKTGTRDFMQVFANGGLGGILVCINSIYPNELWYLIYVASLSAVCADTWATEIGTLKKNKTYNILTFKPAEQGISGGVSIPGTFGALAGTLVIALSALFWIETGMIQYFAVIITAGMFGSFFDSILGATIQAQMQCNVCRKITEKDIHCGMETSHVKGYYWMNNDLVNLLAGISGGLVILLFIGTLN